METKMTKHNFRRFLFDILRDTNTAKYSTIRFAALIGLLLLTTTVVMSLIVMWKTKVVDHVLLVELIGFVLTLLGFKTNFGFKNNDTQIITTGNDDGQMGDGQISNNTKQLLTETKPDTVNDNLKN
jgi:hypothetical protein